MSLKFDGFLLASEAKTITVQSFCLERDTGIEPVSPPWEGGVEPLN